MHTGMQLIRDCDISGWNGLDRCASYSMSAFYARCHRLPNILFSKEEEDAPYILSTFLYKHNPKKVHSRKYIELLPTHTHIPSSHSKYSRTRSSILYGSTVRGRGGWLRLYFSGNSHPERVEFKGHVCSMWCVPMSLIYSRYLRHYLESGRVQK